MSFTSVSYDRKRKKLLDLEHLHTARRTVMLLLEKKFVWFYRSRYQLIVLLRLITNPTRLNSSEPKRSQTSYQLVLGSAAGGSEPVATGIVELEVVVILAGGDELQVVLQVVRHRRAGSEL